jgi:hypothetical protein
LHFLQKKIRNSQILRRNLQILRIIFSHNLRIKLKGSNISWQIVVFSVL